MNNSLTYITNPPPAAISQGGARFTKIYIGHFDIAVRCRQFAAAPRGGLLLARGSRTPAAVGEQHTAHGYSPNKLSLIKL